MDLCIKVNSILLSSLLTSISFDAMIIPYIAQTSESFQCFYFTHKMARHFLNTSKSILCCYSFHLSSHSYHFLPIIAVIQCVIFALFHFFLTAVFKAPPVFISKKKHKNLKYLTKILYPAAYYRSVQTEPYKHHEVNIFWDAGGEQRSGCG